MPEYIEREALLESLGFEEEKKNMVLPGSTFDVILKAPSADVAPVVRCKDCKQAYINSFSKASGVCLCRFWTNRGDGNQAIMQQDDFCSYGERRNDMDLEAHHE